ncbi:MAG: DUF4397 domain-containing protein [Gammaproteobacteria bacterium]|nr:DUF4397 domain-containing protein [Gammaproteobacteria bacterium]
MKKQAYAVSMLSAALFLAACDGKDGVNGIDGANGLDGDNGFNTLIAFRDIPKGDAVCLGGGQAVDSGLDTNRNNVLDAGEVTASEIVDCAATPTLRALHASPDAPAVNIWVDGVPALPGVDYTMGSGFVPMAEENNIQVEAIIPGVDTADRIVIDADLQFDYSTETTVIATRNLADNEGVPFPLIITNPSDERITQGYFRAQVVHAAPSAGDVDVYVTALGADLDGSAPVNGAGTPLEFEKSTERLEVPEGGYQIRITEAGNADNVVFDTGDMTPVTLPAGADLMIVAVENTGPGAAPVKLIVLDGQTADTVIYDAATPASVVAVHLSPDAPAVDILADVTATPEVEAITLVENVSFLEFCDISVPAPGEYTINVALNDGGVIAYTFDPLSFAKGDEALAIVSGLATPGLDPALTDITLPGNTRSVVTETKLRITHSSPSTPAVDVKIVERGAGFGGDPVYLAEGVTFGLDTTQLSVPTGNYDAYVALAGAAEPAISVEGLLDFTGGEVLDIIARDGEGGPELLVLDYSDEGNVAACPAPAI